MFARRPRFALLALFVVAAVASSRSAHAQWRSVYDQGMALENQGKHQDAIRVLERSARMAVEEEGADTQIVAAITNQVGMIYDDLGKYADAEKWYLFSLRAAMNSEGQFSKDTGNAHNNLMVTYVRLDRNTEAEKHGLAALRIWERMYGANSKEVAMTAGNLGDVLKNQGKFDQAETIKLRALSIKRQVYGDKHLEVATALAGLGDLVRERGRLNDAGTMLRQAAAIAEATAPQSPQAGNVWNNLGLVYRDQGNYDASLAAFSKSLAIAKANWGNRHPDVALAFNNLGAVLTDMGRLADAEKVQLQAYEIHREVFGEKHLSVGRDLSNLAGTYRLMGRNKEAVSSAFHGLAIYEQVLGNEHPGLISPLTQIAELMTLAKNYDEAEKVHRRLVALAEKAHGQEHPQVQTVVGHLGKMLLEADRFDEADPHLVRAAAMAEKILPPDHPAIGDALTNLANLRLYQKRPEDSAALHRRAIEVYRKRLAGDGIPVTNGLYNVAIVQGRQGDWLSAAKTSDEARRGIRRLVAQMLPALAEAEQLEFLDHNYEKNFQIALNLAYQGRKNAEVVALSAGWVINGKGVAQQVLAESALLARDAQDPATRRAIAQLLEVRRQLAGLVLGTANGDEARKRLAELTEREASLAKRIGRAQARDPWITLEAVRQQIPPDAVLVELMRSSHMDWQMLRRTAEGRYLAWIIPPAGKGDVTLVELGSVEQIEDAVARCRKTLVDARTQILEDGEAEAEKAAQTELAAASAHLLKPIEKHLSPFKRWVLSPDADLWLVPWAALVQENGKYVVEDHVVSLVVSGRDLVQDAASEVSGNAALVLADPDYDLKQGGLADDTAKKTQASGGTSRSATRAFSGAWQRLPGTAEECRAVAPSLTSFAKREPQILSGEAASEEAIKQAYQPRALVLATHGFFFDPPKNAQKGETDVVPTPAELKSQAFLENPLLRCGLALSGANRSQARRQAGAEDGVLTGLEIVGLDLRGTELAVLSACETGLGDVRGGEGVAGLRQAFQLAGARSVIASLWKVPDAETAQLMSGFWERLAKGEDKAEALRGAQLSLIEARRKQGAAHPLFWAAFTLTGNWNSPPVGAERKRPVASSLIEAVVVAANADIMDGAKPLAKVARGDRLQVAERKGDWILVRVPGNEARTGWILLKHVRIEE